MTIRMPSKQLTSLLTTDGTASFLLPDGRDAILNSVLREDGSGKSFMVTVTVDDLPWYVGHGRSAAIMYRTKQETLRVVTY